MQIARHKLLKDDGTPINFEASPNTKGKLDPRYLIIHYTAGRSARESIDWFLNPAAKASAHLTIGRDGKITQQVAFDRIAWHAGESRWQDLIGMNKYSIGIELDNAGRLSFTGTKWRAWFGGDYDHDVVLQATHKNETALSGWHTYTEKQLDATIEVSRLLIATYNLIDVLGHEDISPGRKADPGPAFPMQSFRSRVLGRSGDDPTVYKATAELNVRSGPGTQFAALPGSPVPIGTKLDVLASQGSWRQVDVLDVVNGVNDMSGWVHSRFITES